jgi:hypothetical protein
MTCEANSEFRTTRDFAATALRGVRRLADIKDSSDPAKLRGVISVLGGNQLHTDLKLTAQMIAQ